MAISNSCEIADHKNCPELLYDNEQNRYQCKCSCHVRTTSSEDLQMEKDKQGITRADEMRAETVPQTLQSLCGVFQLIQIQLEENFRPQSVVKRIKILICLFIIEALLT